MKVLNREGIIRMGGRSQGGGGVSVGGGSGSVAGLASEAWVEENYISKAFFNRLFTIHSASSVIDPNDPDEEQTIDSIEALVGLWTEQYLSALGQGSGGGGGGGITLNDPLDAINSAGLSDPVTAGSALVWYGGAWTYSPSARLQVAGLNSSAAVSVTGSVTATSFVRQGGTSSMFLKADGSVDTTVYAAQDWVSQNFITIAFFETLFNAVDANGTKVNANTTTGIDSIRAMFGFWTNEYLSALGQGTGGGGGGVTLNQPLSSINSAGLGAPSVSGSTLVWNGTTWTYSSSIGDTKNTAGSSQQPSGVQLYLIGASAQATWGVTYSNSGCYIGTDGYLYSGGSKVLTSANIPLASTGTIGGILVKAATAATPTLAAGATADRYYGLQIDGNGVAFVNVPWTDTDTKNTAGAGTLPTASTLYLVGAPNYDSDWQQTYTNSGCYISADGYLYSGGVKVITSTSGLVSGISIGGDTPIEPTNGIVQIPAYPVNTDTLNTAGSTQKPSNVAIYLVGASAQATYGQTYSDSGCYISADGYLYSGGVRVLTSGNTVQTITINNGTPISPTNGNVNINCVTSVTSSTVTTALGYTPAASSDLSNYLPLSGGTLTSSANNVLTLNSTNSAETGIQIQRNGTIRAWFGYYDNFAYMYNQARRKYLKYNDDGTLTFEGYVVYHSGNCTIPSLTGYATETWVGNNYLSLSGGTLSGTGNILTLSSNSTNAWIYFNTTKSSTLATRASVGYYNNFAFISNEATYARIGVADDGTPQYWNSATGTNKYTLYHTGNCTIPSLAGYATESWVSSNYLSLGGGLLTECLRIKVVNNYGNYNEGIRIMDAPNKWAGITFGAEGNTGITPLTGRTAWFAAKTDGNKFIITPNSSSDTTGLTLNSGGDLYWRNNVVYHTGNCTIPTKTSQLTNDSGFVTSATDTKNTAGATNLASTKLFLIGATVQNTDPVTYSNSAIYISGANSIYTEVSSNTWAYSRWKSGTNSWDIGTNSEEGHTYSKGGFGIRQDGAGNNGIYIKRNTSAYGKLVIQVPSAGECSIGFNVAGYNKWTCGYTGSNDNFGWYYGDDNQSSSGTGWKMTLSNGGALSCTSLSTSAQVSATGNIGSGANISATGDITAGAHVYTEKIGNGMTNMRFNSNGNVGIGVNNTSGYLLQVNGAVAGTSWTNLSDMRQKNYIEDESIELWQVAGAPLFKFTWKNPQFGADLHIGSSAQYWQTIVPEAVTTDGLGNLGLQYDVVALLAAITTAKKVQEHERRIEELERENKVLWNMIATLKAA